MGMLRDLWDRILGATATGATASQSGSLAQQVAWLTQQVALLAQQKGAMRVTGTGYQLIPVGPSAGVAVSSAAAASTYGSWTELAASVSPAVYVVGIVVVPSVSSSNYNYIQVQLGTGSAGAEQAVSTVRFPVRRMSNSLMAASLSHMLPYPIAVANGTRLACRVADGSSVELTHSVSLIVVNQSDLVSL